MTRYEIKEHKLTIIFMITWNLNMKIGSPSIPLSLNERTNFIGSFSFLFLFPPPPLPPSFFFFFSFVVKNSVTCRHHYLSLESGLPLVYDTWDTNRIEGRNSLVDPTPPWVYLGPSEVLNSSVSVQRPSVLTQLKRSLSWPLFSWYFLRENSQGVWGLVVYVSSFNGFLVPSR